ncbi:MAG: hypothetical protein K9L17_03840 [Clostridiales bacterium]|nr:hypothetical protein [Clostridiales bacterium]
MPDQSPSEIVIIGIEILQPQRWIAELSQPIKEVVGEAANTVKAEVLYA